ncbi:MULTISPECIES: hypothetical protein [unclassified Streptomyces]|uniref:hypothetical protein n=1 Tax=unclassified Streptomyces TaxID=2593676 RepID=UPI00381595AA
MARTEEEWLHIARYVRHAVNKIGPEHLPLCLPGEPRECGQNGYQHAMLWAAEMKAVAHHLIEEGAATHEEGTFFAKQVYQDRLSALREKAPQNV